MEKHDGGGVFVPGNEARFYSNLSPGEIHTSSTLKRATKEIIYSTYDYDRFIPKRDNRNIRHAHVQAIIKSTKEFGQRKADPIEVIVVGKDDRGRLIFQINRGHHRFVAWKSMGAPIRFVIEDRLVDEEKLPLLTVTIHDYLDKRVRGGEHPDYLKLRMYMVRTGIPIGKCIALLSDMLVGSKSLNDSFKAGDFRIAENTDMAAFVEEVVHCCKANRYVYATHNQFIAALQAVSLVKQFDLEQFLRRIERNPVFGKETRSTRDQYLTLISDIYNKASKAKNRLDVKHLAELEIEKRSRRRR